MDSSSQSGRPKCRIEIESTPTRCFVRFNFANGHGEIPAGVLMLEPAIWRALRQAIEGWADLEEVAVRDQIIWMPAVVEQLLRSEAEPTDPDAIPDEEEESDITRDDFIDFDEIFGPESDDPEPNE